MSKKFLLLLPLLTGLPLFVTGALKRPPVAPLPSFTAEPITLAPELAPPGLSVAGLLDHALERLSPDRVSWLSLKLWQRMAEDELVFESEGTLQLGPKHCARLDLEVRSGGLPGRWLVVSDGHALAHVTQFGNAEPAVECRLVTPSPTAEQPTPAPPAVVLRELACGGPYALLQVLRPRLKDLAAETGRRLGQPFIRIRGRLDPAPAAVAPNAARADFCYLYLDTQMLWPGRIEWWASDPSRPPRLVLEMEFRDPQVNQPLSIPECIRAFTYRPSGSS